MRWNGSRAALAGSAAFTGVSRRWENEPLFFE